jgi:GH24 family phage-related lysozyme (muramidase)
MDPVLKTQLERDEGRRLAAYQDNAAAKNWTIGVGHLLGAHPRMTVITDAECDALLAWDIQTAMTALLHVFGAGTSFLIFASKEFARYRAMQNMAFNRGEQHMQDSTTITPAIKAALKGTGKWAAVAHAIRTSPWAAQIGARGERLAKQFETGVDQ